MKRAETLAALRAADAFDVLVIGGGIAGAGIALEAARAGAKVALVEARDFASGTSSRSSKLVHGGLRYLAQAQFGLTRESVRERDALLRDAAGLVQPLRFLLPVRRGGRNGRAKLGVGLFLYDQFAGRRTRRWHAADELLGAAPGLDPQGLDGGWSYLDAQTDDARLVLRVLTEARRLSALTLNHAKVEGLTRNPLGVDGARVRDQISGSAFTLKARVVVNATGVWADQVRANLDRAPLLRPLRGSHLLLPAWRLPLAQAIGLFHPDDGRPVFALPWEGRTLVGTTDLDHDAGLDQEPGISAGELDYLLRALQAAFPAFGLSAADVLSTWSGVRPVVSSGRAVDPSKEAREHLITLEDGLITVTGGKLTTFRSTALQALRLAQSRVPALRQLDGTAPVFTPIEHQSRLRTLAPELRARLTARYGSDAAAVVGGAAPDELAPLCGTPTVFAELRWACRAEGVEQLDDLLLRRTRLGLLLRDGAAQLLPRIQPLASQELGWDDARWQAECARYRELIARCYGVPGARP